MDQTILARFRRALTLHRDNLLEWLSNDPHRNKWGTTAMDDQTAEEDLQVLSVIDDALARIDSGTFGQCKFGDGDVETERLELDFTTCVCLSHYSEAQLRDLERDLELAARVQQQLFPCCTPALPGIQIAAHAKPAHIVGGDFYDFFRYRDYAQGVAIADVMGKGLPASMLMANLQASLRILGPEYEDLHGLAKRLNELFRYNLKLIRFISLFLLAIDVEAGVLRYCNAGHNPPLWWSTAAGAVQWLKPTGPALGLLHDPDFRSETVRFRSGDVLLLYTDGLVEARNPEGEAFGEQQLAAYVTHHHEASADDFLNGLWRAAARFTKSRIHDDVALLVIKVQ